MNFVTKLVSTLRGVAGHPVNRGSGMKAAWKFCVAQVASRLIPGDVCVPFPNQTQLLVSPRMKGAAHFITPGLCEFDTMSFVMHFLRAGDLFVDVGANVGAYTVLRGGVAGARGLAFEPSPSTFKYLSRNVALNNLGGRVTPFNLAVGSKEGVMRLTEGLGTENYLCLEGPSENTTEVKITTLDKALEGLSPTVIKIDVEGFETEVVAGGRKTLAQPSLQAVIIERAENALRYGFDEAALHRGIRELAFVPCAYEPLSRSLRQLGPDESGNLIYLRDLPVAQKRLREARPYQFAGLSV
jgi:FkbM family methyltransferase